MTLLQRIEAGFISDQVKLHPELLGRLQKDHMSDLVPKIDEDKARRFNSVKEHHVPHAIDYIAKHDPSPNGSYKKWLVKSYAKGGIRGMEDMSRAKEALTLFHKHKAKLPIEHRDITHYKTLPDLEKRVQPFEEQESSKSKDSDFLNSTPKQATLVHDDKEYKIVTPHTTAASQHFGKNTKWCTAAKQDNYFDSYNDNVNLHYILHKPTNTRWAIAAPKDKHNPDIEYFDQHDNHFEPQNLTKEHPALAKHIKKIKNKQLNMEMGDLDDKSFNSFVDSSKHGFGLDKLAMRNDLKPHHIDKLLNTNSREVSKNLALNPSIEGAGIDKLLEPKYVEDTKHFLPSNPNLESHHIDKLLKNPSEFVLGDLAKRRDLQPHHIDKMLDDGLAKVRFQSDNFLSKNLILSEKHIHKMIDAPPKQYVLRNLSERDDLTPEHKTKLKNHPEVKRDRLNKLSPNYLKHGNII